MQYWLNLFFSLQGRIPRKQFWTGSLILLAAYLCVLAPIFAFWQDEWLDTPSALWVRQAFLATDLLLAWPTFAVNAKRQQDRGHWPWLAWLGLVATLGLSLLDLAGLTETADGFTTLGLGIFVLLSLIVLAIIIELGMRKGTAGPNLYGADPLARH